MTRIARGLAVLGFVAPAARRKHGILAAAALLALCGWAAPVRADVIVDFRDLAIPGETFLSFFTPYESQGFRLTATDPSTGFSAGFQARGANAGGFFAGDRGLAAFSPATSPDNIIELTRIDGDPFDLLSIDLARDFLFDPAPTVIFTGSLVGGGTVSQTFTVTTPPGVAALQTFAFTGFTDLLSVSWGQPPVANGRHQFADVTLDVAATVPTPATLLLLVSAVFAIGAARARRRR
jgi:hypothetical protein